MAWIVRSVPVLVGALAVLLYAESLQSPFQYDDWFTAVASSPDQLPAGRALPSDPERFRPVTTASRAVDHAWELVWPDAVRRFPALGFHLTSILLHGAASVLVWWVVRLWWSDPLVAAVAAALFAVHPFNAEAANYISARSSVLAACAELLALGAYTLWRTGRGRGWWVAAFAGSAAALGAKESAITLPALLWLAEAAVIAPTDTWRARASRLWPWGVLVAGYVAVRFGFVTDVSGGFDYSAGDRIEALAVGLWVVGLAARDFWWPWFLSAEHGIDTLRGAAAWGVVGIAFATLVLGVWAWQQRERARHTGISLAAFGALWWVLAALPPLALPFITHVALYQEHRYYLAGVGFVAAIGWFTARGGRTLANRTGTTLPVVIAAGVLAGLSLMSHSRTVLWKSEVALWTDATEKAPRSPLAYAMLGAAYLGQDRPDLAVTPLERATVLDPRYPLAATNLGAAYAKLDRWEEAVIQYRRALAIDPEYHLARSNLTLAYQRAGRWSEAIAEYEILARQLGETSDLRLRIGALALQAGDMDRAEASFKLALADDSAAYAAWFNLGLVEDRRGFAPKAEEYFRRALALNPADPDVHYRLGVLAARSGRADEAVRAFENALARHPGHALAHYDLARVVDALGRRDEAAVHYRRFLEAAPPDPVWEPARREVTARLVSLGASPGTGEPLPRAIQ
ncbi:MAG: tetratricopeptide repeat protein [Nitrospirota bacterium]